MEQRRSEQVWLIQHFLVLWTSEDFTIQYVLPVIPAGVGCYGFAQIQENP